MKHYYLYPSNLRSTISRDNVFAIVARADSSYVSTQGPNGPLCPENDHEGFHDWFFTGTDNADRITNDYRATIVIFGTWDNTDPNQKLFRVIAIVHYDDRRYVEKEGLAYSEAIACQREPVEMRRVIGELGFWDFDDIVIK